MRSFSLIKAASSDYDPVIDGLLSGEFHRNDLVINDDDERTKRYNKKVMEDKSYYDKVEKAKKAQFRMEMGAWQDEKREERPSKGFWGGIKDKIDDITSGPTDKYMGLDDFGNDKHIEILEELRPHISEATYKKHHDFILKSIQQKADSIKEKKIGSFISRLQGYKPTHLTDKEVEYYTKHKGSLDSDVVKQNNVNKSFKPKSPDLDPYGVKGYIRGHNVAGIGVGALGVGSVLNKKFNNKEKLDSSDAAMLGGSALALGGAGYGSVMNKKYDNKYNEGYSKVKKLDNEMKEIEKRMPSGRDIKLENIKYDKELDRLREERHKVVKQLDKELDMYGGNPEKVDEAMAKYKKGVQEIESKVSKIRARDKEIFPALHKEEEVGKELSKKRDEWTDAFRSLSSVKNELNFHKKVTAGTIGAGTLLTAGGFLYNKYKKRDRK